MRLDMRLARTAWGDGVCMRRPQSRSTLVGQYVCLSVGVCCVCVSCSNDHLPLTAGAGGISLPVSFLSRRLALAQIRHAHALFCLDHRLRMECNGGVQWWSGIAAANGGVQLPPLALHLHSTCTPFATLTLTLTLTSQVCRFAGDEFSSRTACDMSDEPSVYAEATHHGATLLAILPPLSTAQNFPSSESSTPLFEPRTPSPPPFIDDYMEDDESPSPSTTLSRNLPSIFNEDLHAIYDKAHPQVGLLSDTVYHKLLKDQYKFTVTPFYPPTVPFEYSTSYRKRTRYLMETAPALPPAALLECSLAPDYTPGYPLWIGADITRVCRFEYTFDFLLRPSALGGPALLDYTLICNYGTTWLTFLLEHSLAPGPSLLSFTMERLHDALRRRLLP